MPTALDERGPHAGSPRGVPGVPTKGAFRQRPAFVWAEILGGIEFAADMGKEPARRHREARQLRTGQREDSPLGPL